LAHENADLWDVLIPVRRRLPQWLVLSALLGLGAAQLAHFLPRMPERIATHFGADGMPNGWMTRTGFVVFELGILSFMATVIVGSGLLARRRPDLVNVPNKDYWFAPERRVAGAYRLLRHMLWLLCGIVGFFIAVNQLVFDANRPVGEGGGRLSTEGLLWAMGGSILGLLLWIGRLYMLFRRPPEEAARN
jgi:serine/threonine-protein kinase